MSGTATGCKALSAQVLDFDGNKGRRSVSGTKSLGQSKPIMPRLDALFPQSYPQIGHWRSKWKSPSVIIQSIDESAHKEFFVLSILQAAGWPIWPLLLCSVMVLAVIIERLIQLQPHRVVPPDLLPQALATNRATLADPRQAESLAQSGRLGPVLASGLRVIQARPQAGDEEVRATMEMAGRVAAQELERYISLLGTLASAAPLLGLLGTVVGMIEIFGAHQASTGQPAQLAYGISVALYNTALGLIVAIPALLFWRYFRSLVDRHVLAMEVAADRFAQHLARLRH